MANIVGEVKSAFSRIFLCILIALTTACSSNPKQTSTETSATAENYDKQASGLKKPAVNTEITKNTIDVNAAKTKPKPVPTNNTQQPAKPIESKAESQPKQQASPAIKAKPITSKPKLAAQDKSKAPRKKQPAKIVVAKETKNKAEAPKPLAKKTEPAKKVTVKPKTAITKPQSNPVKPKPQPPSFKLDDLPFEMGNWVISESKRTHEQCLLQTKAQKLEDGAGGTPIYLEIHNKRLSIRTKSDIDLSYPGSALLIGSSEYKFDGVNKDTDAFIEAKLNQAINDLKLNDAADITLGFWPTWPRTTTHTTTIDISNAELALKGLAHCNSIIK